MTNVQAPMTNVPPIDECVLVVKLWTLLARIVATTRAISTLVAYAT